MKSSTTLFLQFLIITCPIVLEIRAVQSIRFDGQGQSVQPKVVQSVTTKNNNKEQATNKNPDDNVNDINHNLNHDVNIEANPVQRRHGLMPSTARRRIESGGVKWEPVGKMIVGEAENDRSGHSIAMSDDGRIIAIGAPRNDPGGNWAGHVRVFRLTNEAWKQIGIHIDGKELYEHFGGSLDVSVDGMRLVIGGYKALKRSGVVRVYENVNEEWVQVGADLRGDREHDQFGWSVAISSDGTVIAVGASRDDDNGSDSGSVSVYLEKAETWKLVGSRLYGDVEYDWFGNSVSLSGDGLVLAIGAACAGYAKIYTCQLSSDGERDWVQHAKLNGNSSGDKFGSKISLSRDASHLAVSGYRYAKVYEVSKDESAGVVQVANDIRVQDSYPTILLTNDGRYFIIGDRFNDEFGNDAGRAQVFQLNGEVWEQVGGDLYSLNDPGKYATEVEHQKFGCSVAISGDGSTVAAGSQYSSLGGKAESGHVRVFKMVQSRTLSPTQSFNLGLAIAGLCGIAIIHRPRKKKMVAKRRKLSADEEEELKRAFFA